LSRDPRDERDFFHRKKTSAQRIGETRSSWQASKFTERHASDDVDSNATACSPTTLWVLIEDTLAFRHARPVDFAEVDDYSIGRLLDEGIATL
jgi:hypothetical protein